MWLLLGEMKFSTIISWWVKSHLLLDLCVKIRGWAANNRELWTKLQDVGGQLQKEKALNSHIPGMQCVVHLPMPCLRTRQQLASANIIIGTNLCKCFRWPGTSCIRAVPPAQIGTKVRRWRRKSKWHENKRLFGLGRQMKLVWYFGFLGLITTLRLKILSSSASMRSWSTVARSSEVITMISDSSVLLSPPPDLSSSGESSSGIKSDSSRHHFVTRAFFTGAALR